MVCLNTEQSSMFQISSQDKYTHFHKRLYTIFHKKIMTLLKKNLNTTQFQASKCLGSENIGQLQ